MQQIGHQLVRPVGQAHPRDHVLDLVPRAAFEPEPRVHQIVEPPEHQRQGLIDQPDVGGMRREGGQHAVDEIRRVVVETRIGADNQARRPRQLGLGFRASHPQQVPRFRQQKRDILDREAVTPIADARVQQIRPAEIRGNRQQMLVVVEYLQFARFVRPFGVPGPSDDAPQVQFIDEPPPLGLTVG